VRKIKDLISLIDKGIFEFKDPWRASKKSLSIVVPITSKSEKPRVYIVLDEVKDQINIEDTGRISEAKITGNVDKPTFIRGGTMLKGATQERATQYGVVVIPLKSEPIPVHCIHASKGIRAGASFFASGHVPTKVYSNMVSSRNQNVTWRASSGYRTGYAMASSGLQEALASIPRDDLASTVETIQEFREDLKEILKEIPDYVNQVGTAIIDPDGLVGLEMYDHQDSWKAFSKSIMKSFSDALTREDKFGIFKPEMKAIVPLIKDFLKEIKKAEQNEVFNKNDAKTVILKTEGFVGEYTSLKGKTIHFLVARHKETHERPPITPQRIFTSTPLRQEYQQTTDRETPLETMFTTSAIPRNFKPEKNYGILSSLKSEPKTSTSLTSEVPISKATLSKHLKNFQNLGMIEKQKGENGITRYLLTGKGHVLEEKLRG